MITKIYSSYSDFYNRENKDENGVSQIFADQNPNWEKENKDNKRCWNCSRCSGCSGCSHCSDCSGCSHCSGCSDLENAKPFQNAFPEIPIIENIHQKILEACSNPGALNMGDWHTCETTHCRAGWVVELAGEKGKELEKATTTVFAAMQIYKVSSTIRVYPPRFYEQNEKAMEDMRTCAEAEKALVK